MAHRTYPLKTLREPAPRAGRPIGGGAPIGAGAPAGIAGVLKETASPAVAEEVARVMRLTRTYTLAPELKKGLEEAWERSLFMGESGIRAREHGGFLTALDRDGTVIDTDKSIWFQGRGAWTYATLHRTIEPRAEWREAVNRSRNWMRAKEI